MFATRMTTGLFFFFCIVAVYVNGGGGVCVTRSSQWTMTR